MALQLWETFKESITVYTGLSPTTFFTVAALGLAVYYVVSGMFGSSDHHPQSRPRSFEEEMQPLPPPVQLGEITEEELRDYDGTDPKKPLLMAIKGQIYDVSQSRMFYGPGGPYALFAGKDASRALAKMSFEDKDLNGDLGGLGVFELEALQDWEYKFMSKYVKVGSIKKSEPESVTETQATVEPVQVVPSSESAHDHPAESAHDHHAESTHDHHAESTHDHPAESTYDHPAESAHDHPAESAHEDVNENVEDASSHHAVAEPKEV